MDKTSWRSFPSDTGIHSQSPLPCFKNWVQSLEHAKPVLFLQPVLFVEHSQKARPTRHQASHTKTLANMQEHAIPYWFLYGYEWHEAGSRWFWLNWSLGRFAWSVIPSYLPLGRCFKDWNKQWYPIQRCKPAVPTWKCGWGASNCWSISNVQLIFSLCNVPVKKRKHSLGSLCYAGNGQDEQI